MVASARREAGELATLGHDLRTPLTVIHGYAELLKSGELSPEQRTRACDLILDKCEELNGLIRGFLDSRESEPPVPAPITETA